MPRVDCPKCGVVVARVPWAEPGSRFTRGFEAECAWLMTVANQKTVGVCFVKRWCAVLPWGAVRVTGQLFTGLPSAGFVWFWLFCCCMRVWARL